MKTVIEMACEAGFKASVGKTDKDNVYRQDVNAIGKDVPIEWVERFAELVRADAIAEEREACANVADALDAMNWAEYGEYSSGYGDEIRKRGIQ